MSLITNDTSYPAIRRTTSVMRIGPGPFKNSSQGEDVTTIDRSKLAEVILLEGDEPVDSLEFSDTIGPSTQRWLLAILQARNAVRFYTTAVRQSEEWTCSGERFSWFTSPQNRRDIVRELAEGIMQGKINEVEVN